jgi:hypothetical protein
LLCYFVLGEQRYTLTKLLYDYGLLVNENVYFEIEGTVLVVIAVKGLGFLFASNI